MWKRGIMTISYCVLIRLHSWFKEADMITFRTKFEAMATFDPSVAVIRPCCTFISVLSSYIWVGSFRSSTITSTSSDENDSASAYICSRLLLLERVEVYKDLRLSRLVSDLSPVLMKIYGSLIVTLSTSGSTSDDTYTAFVNLSLKLTLLEVISVDFHVN